jgi:phosphate/sulfate permease
MNIFLAAVIILFLLAIFDLVAGVANDAVNFINSAIGAKVASRTTILIVAAIGILIGAMFSSGMMEIAKQGVFSPEKLTFEEILIVFLAVLITDVILLDAFNTFGLPTSTTVSLVFELLGAAVAVSTWKILGAGGSLAQLSEYINTAKAMAIITGILTSVWISLSVSIVVQYFSRLLFSFEYERRFKWIGSIWCGLAFASMTYYLVIKGLKGASFVSESFIKSVTANSGQSFFYLFLGGTAVAQTLMWMRFNVLKILVLYGTASLAMAFAGNDLVNFIGPSIAAMDAYQIWVQSGVPADELTMESLKKPVATNTYILLASGAIMAATLFLSRKARTVTETEVGLARQDTGLERFKPNALSRFLVFTVRRVGRLITAIIPANILMAIESNFQRPQREVHPDAPAFDLIRATVNLTTASSLIAIGTAMKLPLSTTYVTFLVAMGTSLSDRAWGRESAVYRVSGVLSVIGGWFVTALIAFSISIFFASIIYFTREVGVIVSLLLAASAIWHSFKVHARREKSFSEEKRVLQQQEIGMRATLDQATADAISLLQKVRQAYVGTLYGFVNEDATSLKAIREELKDIELATEHKRMTLFHRIAHSDPAELPTNRRVLKVFDLGHDILLSLRDLVRRCSNHVLNSHWPPNPEQAVMVNRLAASMDSYLDNAAKFMAGSDSVSALEFRNQKLALYAEIEELIKFHVTSTKDTATSRNVESISRILMEAKDLVAISARMLKHYDKRVRGNRSESASSPELSSEQIDGQDT